MNAPPLQVARSIHRLARIFFLLQIHLWLVLGAFPAPARAQDPARAGGRPEPDVAIVYDGATDMQGKGYIHALFVDNLLGHFGLHGQIIPVATYQKGALDRYKAAFFIGVHPNTEFPAGLLDDIRAYKAPFAWLGQNIGQLLDTPEAMRQYGFSFEEYMKNAGVKRVTYKNTVLPKVEQDLNLVTIQSKAVQVVATAAYGDVQKPYALHRGRFWYLADSPFAYPEEGGYYLIFCDLLHDILEIQHPAEHKALARIEDVSVDLDPVELKRVADLLARNDVPFQIALIPVFRDPSKELEVRLTDRRSLADTVHYMISKGGTPIMHGVTHQYRGVSGDDYEFWDDTADHAVAGDSAEFVMRRLQLGVSECFAVNIFPVAFEVPHYAASATDYKAMQRVFDLFYDRTISTASLNSQQYFPYRLVDYWGRSVLPENLGYVPIENPVPREVLQAARNMRVVRDGMASFYFHPFLNPALLQEIINGIKDLGYQFVSIREFPSELDYQGRFVVRTSSGTAEMMPQNEYWRLRLYDKQGDLVETHLSDQKRTGHVEVAVNVPPGGWAAVDLLRQHPAEHIEPAVATRVRQWWIQLVSSGRAPIIHNFVSDKNAAILWLQKPPTAAAARNQESYRSVLDTFGYEVRLISPADFLKSPPDHDTIVVVPEASCASMAAAGQQFIARYISTGGKVVADGRQPWLTKVGVKWEGRQITVGTISDELYPEMYLHWLPEEKVERFTPPEDVHELMVDSESGQPVAFSDDYGSGLYLYLAAPLDPYTKDGTSHYPYFPRYMTDTFGSNTSMRSATIETYFDPSYKPGADLNRLAVQWRKSGIRIIYAAAWIFYPQYTYNYTEFVKACHRSGIAVYAWFVLPQTTPRMWEEHPEWREKTATGADGKVGWRLLMNLENPDCFRASMDWVKQTLEAQPWDGVNITELNFDADFRDYMKPESFVPMNGETRAEFRKKSGFDPMQLFQPESANYWKTNHAALDKFLKYRENVVTEWHRKVLRELEPLRKAKNWEVIVTAMDSLHSKYVRPALGVDSRRIAGLMKEFDFTLQVEDPAEYWMKPPDRYRRFAQTYSKLIKDPRRLMFDVNVVPGRDLRGTNLPSATATGVELAQTVVAAASASGRVAIYAEHTVPVQDWHFIRVALTKASDFKGRDTDWKVSGDTPVLLTPAEDRDYYLDGRLWPAVSSDGVLAPPGKHSVSTHRPWYHFLDPGALSSRLLSITGDLLDARVMPTGLVLRYSSPGRTIVVFNQRPREFLIDGHQSEVPVDMVNGTWSASLPAGVHWVAVVTNTKAGVAVNLWGWASASAINAFGGLATVLMLLIYFEVRVRRLVRRRA